EIQPRYNIAPSQPVLVLQPDSGRILVTEVRWGISLPSPRDGRARELINVRSETALGTGWFRDLLDRRRVLVPASHFYEWRTTAGRRQPLLIGPAKGDSLVMAGLLGRWVQESTGEVVPAVAILTTAANGLLATIHDRMPVLLPRASWGRWLDPDADAGDVADLLVPCADELLLVRPVSRLVNDVANEGAALLVAEPDPQLQLPL
ncbi:MAG: SOS response-associated peptidase, partial [Candidatus Dormibacteraeota bacterium]|nr:SOS response-associated peptidase [Candidatus Dormibacteraeota bacterium]